MPEMKQEWELSLDDFARFRVWIGVHNNDAGEPWYELSDEATFRPWTGPLPIPAEKPFALVYATFTLQDRSSYPGYVRATAEDWDVPPPPRVTRNGQAVTYRSITARSAGSPLAILGYQQPCLFVNRMSFSFWGGLRGKSPEQRQAFYAAIGKDPESVFPLRFTIDPDLATGILTGQVDGFYRHVSKQAPAVER